MRAFSTIDCDVHPHVKDGVASLEPYLSAAWRRRLLGASHGKSWAKDVYASKFTLPQNDLYINPVGAMRRDSFPRTARSPDPTRSSLPVNCSTASRSTVRC